ncbi:hypothetical protein N0V90_001603 [Kalmusia sp. IMI 367209]|nr:hypothetical protein N0V90_001603 [Kalmusia sp. IMI 367209]
MAQTLKLGDCLQKLLEAPNSAARTSGVVSGVGQKQLVRMVRTLLVLQNVEREVASAYSAIADVLQPGYPKYALLLHDLVKTASENTPSASQLLNTNTYDPQSSSIAPEISFGYTSDQPTSAAAPIESPFPNHDSGQDSYSSHERSGIQSLYTDLTLDYNSFTASLAAYDGDLTNAFDYMS